MRVVILAGGKGLRMGDYGERIPKPLIEIGGKPLLLHVMNLFASQGHYDFLVAAGYLGSQIRDWARSSYLPWNVEVIDTGLNTATGGRIKILSEERRLKERFFLSYADQITDINLPSLLEHHKIWNLQAEFLATLTVVQPRNPFGVVKLGRFDEVDAFDEKPRMESWISGGLFVLEPEVLEFLTLESDFERETLPALVQRGKLTAYRHTGMWSTINSPKDLQELEQEWAEGRWAGTKV